MTEPGSPQLENDPSILPTAEAVMEQASLETNEQPRYERRSVYAAAPILRIMRKYRDQFPAPHPEEQNMLPDQVDAMVLDLMSLANEYLTTPQNAPAAEQQRKRIAEFELFDTLDGPELADAFLKELDLEHSSRLTEETPPDPVSQDIEQSIVRLLSVERVRTQFEQIYTQESQLHRSGRKSITKLMKLEGAIDTARARYRQRQNEPRGVDPQSAPIPTGVIARNLSKYLEIIATLEKRVDLKEARLSSKELGLLESSRLMKTRRQMREHGFALTESRQALFDRISELTSAGYKIFLGGPTGTGKTSLAVFAMRQIVGQDNQFEVVSWSSETTVRDLFGKPIIKANPDGAIESAMQKGPYARVLSGETRGIVNDEFTAGQTASHLSLKRIWHARPGEGINLPGFNGTVFTKENYLEISTGNLRSKQHQQREDMDPAVAREFVSISVPFMNANEAKRVLLSSFMHEAGFLQLSRRDVEMIDQLCRAAEFTQKAFEGKFTPEERQNDIYKQIDPSGAEIRLTKTFLDSGTLFRLVGGVTGHAFGDHMQINLGREINENPHLEALPHEKQAFKKILKAFGFNLDASTPAEFYKPLITTGAADSTRPYILPSEMDFLSTVEKIDTDEFPDEEPPEKESPFKKREDELFASALSSSEIPESRKATLRQERTATPEGTVSTTEAREIFKANFFGPNEIQAAFKLEQLSVPPIPFSRAELEQAERSGCMLILRHPFTMQEMNARLQGKAEDGGKLLNADTGAGTVKDDTWYREEAFYTTEKLKAEWVLTTKELIPDSTNKNYLQQTDRIAEYVKNEYFAGQPLPPEFEAALAEYATQRAEIEELMTSNWQEAAKRLEELKLTQLTRPTPGAVLYDLIARANANTKERGLQAKYAWTARRESVGGILVHVGYFDAGGALVYRWSPGDAHPVIGVVFSRSQSK